MIISQDGQKLSQYQKSPQIPGVDLYQPLPSSTLCPRYILLDNGTEFKNLMDHILQQLGIDHIFYAPYHPQSNRKLEVFPKYLKPTLKKLCEKDPTNWDKYLNQVHTSYCVTLNLTTTETPFFLVYGRDPYLPLHQLLEPMQHLQGTQNLEDST